MNRRTRRGRPAVHQAPHRDFTVDTDTIAQRYDSKPLSSPRPGADVQAIRCDSELADGPVFGPLEPLWSTVERLANGDEVVLHASIRRVIR